GGRVGVVVVRLVVVVEVVIVVVVVVAEVAATPKFQMLVLDVRTVSRMSPSARRVRSVTQGSGDAEPGAPVQSGTSVPSLNVWIVVSSSPVGTREASIWKTTTSGLPGVAAGALLSTCLGRAWKAGGGGCGARVSEECTRVG